MRNRNFTKKMLMLTFCMVLIVSMLSGCKGNGESANSSSSSFKAGTFAGEAEGKEGVIKVEVTMDEPDKIKDIKIVSQSETGGLGDSALEKIKDQILEGQTLAVDAVSGASLSSEAMLAAVEDAVTKGGGNLKSSKPVACKKRVKVKRKSLNQT